MRPKRQSRCWFGKPNTQAKLLKTVALDKALFLNKKSMLTKFKEIKNR